MDLEYANLLLGKAGRKEGKAVRLLLLKEGAISRQTVTGNSQVDEEGITNAAE